VFDLAHLGDEFSFLGKLFGERASGDDHFHSGWSVSDEVEDLAEVQELMMKGKIEFIKDDDVALCPGQDTLDFFPAIAGGGHIGRRRFSTDEAGTAATNDPDLVSEPAEGGQFRRGAPFEKLGKEHAESRADGAQRQAEGCGGFAFAVAGVDLDAGRMEF